MLRLLMDLRLLTGNRVEAPGGSVPADVIPETLPSLYTSPFFNCCCYPCGVYVTFAGAGDNLGQGALNPLSTDACIISVMFSSKSCICIVTSTLEFLLPLVAFLWNADTTPFALIIISTKEDY